MNTLVVFPKYQKNNVGTKLTFSQINSRYMKLLVTIDVLLQKKNLGGRQFYQKLKFSFDLIDNGDDFVTSDLLEGWALTQNIAFS